MIDLPKKKKQQCLNGFCSNNECLVQKELINIIIDLEKENKIIRDDNSWMRNCLMNCTCHFGKKK